jgi:high-affinity K+ transport system ATPase subunit B
MSNQNYENHAQYVTAYHKVILPILFLTLVGSVVNLYQSWGEHQRIYSASLIVVLTVCLIFTFLFAMTGKLLDPRLSVKQVVGLRFASDEEFVALARKAAEESLTPDAIKRAVKNWRADTYRV